EVRSDDIGGLVGRSVVDDDQLEVGDGLSEHARDRVPEIGRAVVRDDRGADPGHPFSGTPGSEPLTQGLRKAVQDAARWENAPMPKTVVILAGGPGRAVVELPADATVIAADAAADEGGRVDLLIGDLDSIPAEAVAGIARVERHATEKDE